MFSLCPLILVEFLGLEKLSNSFGLLNMFQGIGTVAGPPLAGTNRKGYLDVFQIAYVEIPTYDSFTGKAISFI